RVVSCLIDDSIDITLAGPHCLAASLGTTAMTDETAPDPLAELDAMRGVHTILVAPPAESQKRVLAWVAGTLNIPASVSANTPTQTRRQDPIDALSTNPAPTVGYTAFADLFGDADPSSDADKALVGGYWLQVVCGAEDFSSQS